MPDWAKEIAKALMSGLIAGLATAGTALVGDQVITAAEGVAIAFATVTSIYGVYWTPDSMSPLRKALRDSQK